MFASITDSLYGMHNLWHYESHGFIQFELSDSG